MIEVIRRLCLCMGLILGLAAALPAAAQTYTVSSITTGDFGNIVAANSGQTVFRANPASGAATRISGSGTRLSTAQVRSLVTIRCGNQTACNTANALIAVTVGGAPSGRAAALQNFTVSTSGATATITLAPGSGSTISFRIGAVGMNSTKTFWLGYDLPINGNTSAAATGLASAGFVITSSRVSGSRANSLAGMTRANVFRAIAISGTGNMNFGKVIRPRSGSGRVSLTAATGAVTVSGAGVVELLPAATSAANFAISGEGGQAVSLSIPGTFTMNGPAGTITVTTTPTISGAQALSGTLGAAGSLNLQVGGSFPLDAATATGSYSGTLAVTVQYN